VCRDFAHLAISLCRALNIPARFVTGYACYADPPADFHALFEAYLGGQWRLFDPTRLSPVEDLVRIGTGRDASEAEQAAPEGAGPAEPSGAPSCLDETIADELGQGYRRKGVQKRDFLKKHRFELSGVGGFYASDVLSSTYAYGGALSFFPSEDFGLEVMATCEPRRSPILDPGMTLARAVP